MAKKQSKKDDEASGRTTLRLPPPLDAEAAKVVARTGVSLSDLLRQGMVRLVLELRDTGGIRLLTLPPADT